MLNSRGQSISGTGFASGGLNFPIVAAIDPNGTAWIVNYGNASVTTLSSTGQPLSSATAGYTAASFAFPTSIAIDANRNAWIGDQNNDVITRISPDGTQSLAVSCCNGPNGLAIDQRGNIWAANFFGDSVSEISGTGTVISSGYTGGGILHPQGIAIDGSGSVWVANFRGPSITQLAGSASSNPGSLLSPAAGWAPRLPDARGLRHRRRRQRKPLGHKLRRRHPHRVRRHRRSSQNPTSRPPTSPLKQNHRTCFRLCSSS